MAQDNQSVPMTEDGRYIVVSGRRWRATDPSIPDNLRTELVSELMAARRAVRSATTKAATAAARRRVHDAKVALGERGAPWWEPLDDDAQRTRIAAALRTMLRKRDPDATVCPSDIARIAAGDEWRTSMDAVREVVGELRSGKQVEVLQRGEAVTADAAISGPIRVGRGSSFDR